MSSANVSAFRAIAASTLGALVLISVYASVLMHGESVRTCARIVSHCVSLAMIVAWPLIYRILMPTDSLGTPYALVGFLWPVLIIAIDIFSMRRHTYETQRQPKRQFATMDANVVCSLTFGIATFLGVQRKPEVSKLFLWSILACVAFIMPSPYTDGTSLFTVSFDTFQKGIIAYATGFLISGVVLMMSASSSPSSSLSSPSSSLSPASSSLSSPASSLSSSRSTKKLSSLSSSLSSLRSSSATTEILSASSDVFDKRFIEELRRRLRDDLLKEDAA